MLIVEQDREKFVPSPRSPHCPPHSGQAGGSLLQFIISCKNLVQGKIRNLITTGASFHFLLAQPTWSYQAHSRRWQCSALQNGLFDSSETHFLYNMYARDAWSVSSSVYHGIVLKRVVNIMSESERERCQNSVGHSEYPSVLQAQAGSQQVLLTLLTTGNWILFITKLYTEQSFNGRK